MIGRGQRARFVEPPSRPNRDPSTQQSPFQPVEARRTRPDPSPAGSGRSPPTPARQRAACSSFCTIALYKAPCAMRLDVTDPRPRATSKCLKGADLIDHFLRHNRGFNVDEPPPEAGQVPVAHVGADRDTVRGCAIADATHDRGVAGVEATRDIGAGHQAEQCVVITHGPVAEALAEVAVEVNRGRHCHGQSNVPRLMSMTM